MKKLITSILLLLTGVFSSNAGMVSFESITTEDGLIQNTVLCMLQDKKGFIWIGTEDGLNKYDGKRFWSYTHQVNDSTSLSDNYIGELFEDRQGRLWVGTRSGLNIYDELTNSFVKVPLEPYSPAVFITAITQDHRGSIWAGTDGAGLLSISVDSLNSGLSFRIHQFLHRSSDATSIINNNIFSLQADAMKNLWIGTQQGLSKLPGKFITGLPKDAIFERVEICRDGNCRFPEERFYTILNDGNKIWFGTLGPYIYVYDYSKAENERWRTIRNPAKILIPNSEPLVTQMVFDADRNLWMTLGNEGLGKITFTEDSLVFSQFRHDKNLPRGLASGTCVSMLQDRTGMIWIGTLEGISLFNPAQEKFYARQFALAAAGQYELNVQSFYLAYNRFYFFGISDSGLFIYDQAKAATHKIQQLKNLDVYCIEQDDEGDFWLCTNNGVAYLKGASLFLSSGKDVSVNEHCDVKLYSKNSPSGAASIQSNLVFTIAADHKNRIWIGTGQGLSWLDPATEKITRVNLNPGNPSLFAEKIIRHLLIDAANQLWIATDGGLFVYNLTANNFRRIEGGKSDSTKLPSLRITSLHLDFSNQLWIGTGGNGISRYLAADGTFKTFSEKNGLASNVVQSIQSDPSGFLWISTNKGLSRFNKSTGIFSNYNQKDGLVNNEFNPLASMFTPDGYLFFGSVNGYNSFHPDSVRKNSTVPPVVLTDFRLLDKSLLADNADIRKRILSGLPVTFAYNNNNFSFEFASLNFINADNNRYAVMLDGFDKDWVHLGGRNFISYTNLDPGTYTLRIKASNNDNVWNEAGISQIIVIRPPFFRTWWFRIAVVLFITLLIYIYYREHIRSIENKKEKELALRQTLLKEQFLANMSHEIRTPLNAIIGMTRLLHEKNPKPDQLKYLNAITQSSDHLLVLINDILDFSKIEAGKIEVESIPFNLRNAINNVHTTLRFKAEEKGLTFSARISPEVPAAVIGDPVRLAQVLINLAGNAIKFTSKGSVMITCSAQNIEYGNARLVFQVIDTGVGIAEESIGKIFESFTQENSSVSREFGGTGLGLAISKRLIEMQGGTISVSSTKGEGSVFTVSVPYTISKEDVEIAVVETIDADLRKKLADLRILLVDDNHFNQLVAIDTLELELARVTVDVAENGQEAVRLVGENNYDVVLMDVQMPVMNGLEATRAIRKMASPKNKTRIIAMTASAMKTEVEHCFASGMDDFIAKPFNTIDLLKKMSRLISKMKVVA